MVSTKNGIRMNMGRFSKKGLDSNADIKYSLSESTRTCPSK